MKDKDFKKLLEKYNSGQCTPEEAAWLENGYLRWNEEDKLHLSEDQLSEARELMWGEIAEKTSSPVVRKLWPRIAAAASILIVSAVAGYLLLRQPKSDQLANNDPDKMLPINNGVTLTLADGSKLPLKYGHNGKIIHAANALQRDSLLTYDPEQKVAEEEINTVTNNSGRKFGLQLADGTEVLLDVQSSLTYPTAFVGKQRNVSMTGQVYFKVKHNASHPFYVHAKNQVIQDVGTEFNVNSSGDNDGERTTLISGAASVKLANKNDPAVRLTPGQQALMIGDKLAARTADMEEETGWLQDKLVFNHETLENILNKVGRIYNVRFVWTDNQLKNLKYIGAVSRKRSLSTVLNFLRRSGEVDFAIDGSTIKVLKKQQ